MPKLTFWTVKRRKRLAALAAKGLSARAIAPRLAGPEHAPTAVAVRTVAARFGIALVNQGGRPPKRKRGARKHKGKRTRRDTGRKATHNAAVTQVPNRSNA